MKKIFFLRKLTRFLGLNSLIFRIIYRNNSYEQLYDNFFTSKLSPGFVVYDIGANLGHYSTIFSKTITDAGEVYAFEPSFINFNKLSEATQTFNNISIFNIGIGSKKKRLFISQGSDEIGATSRMCETETSLGQWVDIDSIDNFVLTNKFPNAIKIDVEGFELEVLEGAIESLKSNKLKVVGIEIHTSILESMYKNGNPIKEIESILNKCGFEVKWTDFSHIVAFRN